MSGLLALLDDVAGIAKIAAASIDDVTTQAAKAGSKVAGVIIDDAAVTPKYLTGFTAKRELPMIWKITRGSLFNKIIILLPVLLLLNAFAPWVITPLLMLGGCYLCFEGTEKVFHWLFPHKDVHVEQDMDIGDPAHLEEARVKGAIKTDFILSAEIMTIILANIEEGSFWFEAATLGVAGLAVTVLVYGSVALIVKMDDVGLWLATNGNSRPSRGLGGLLVRGMPLLLKTLTIVGTAAMLWVGGSIILHGMEVLGFPWLYETIHHAAVAVAHAIAVATGVVEWVVTAFLMGVFALALGAVLVPLGNRVFGPLVDAIIKPIKRMA